FVADAPASSIRGDHSRDASPQSSARRAPAQTRAGVDGRIATGWRIACTRQGFAARAFRRAAMWCETEHGTQNMITHGTRHLVLAALAIVLVAAGAWPSAGGPDKSGKPVKDPAPDAFGAHDPARGPAGSALPVGTIPATAPVG